MLRHDDSSLSAHLNVPQIATFKSDRIRSDAVKFGSTFHHIKDLTVSKSPLQTAGFSVLSKASRRVVPVPCYGIGYLHSFSSNVEELLISLVARYNFDHVARP